MYKPIVSILAYSLTYTLIVCVPSSPSMVTMRQSCRLGAFGGN